MTSGARDPAEALSRWLLSSDQVPTDLAERLEVTAIEAHRLTAWRFQGMWRRAYVGKIGRLRERHEVIVRESINEAGELERVAEGTRRKSADLTMVDIDGAESGPFDVVALEGDAPSPPGPGWFSRAARGVAWEEVQGDPERWAALGAPQVREVADRSLRLSLGSPDILDLETDDDLQLATTSRAPATFWVLTGAVDGRPLRAVLGPDGAVWGDAPSAEVPAAQSQASATTLLIGGGYALAALAGMLAFVVPGVIIAVVGFLHVRHRLQARERALAARRAAQAPAVRALVVPHLS